MDALVVGKVLRRHPQDVIVFARHQVADKDVRAELYRRFEFGERLGELSGERNMHDGDHRVIERFLRQVRVIAADDARFLQDVETTRAGRRREPDPLGKLRVRDAPVLLEDAEYRSIYCIECAQRGFLRR